MKFEKTRPKPQFHPIIITLESEVEAQALRAALAAIVSHGLDGDFLFKLFDKLNDQFTRDERTLKPEGTIHLRKV